MYNIHDWCISRQLWWGHRIPAWYCRDCGRIMVAMDAPEKCDKCGGPLDQDEDVLDTWFSSGLWPFGTLGWPDETEDLKTFYPTDLMSTGFDIIFFWVARMIMLGLKFRGEIPFKHVFINGLVRDLKRRKMSKSEGNIIDPLEMIDKYGTDALRFTLAALAVPGMDLALSEERMAGYQAFANKIWNASRFVLMNLKSERPEVREADLTLADRWIRSRVSAVTAQLDESLTQYKFYEAADLLYHFIWHEFCDWYIEFAKVGLREGNATTEAVLADALDRILRLLHPFMPFITEEIWQHLPGAGQSIVVAPYPKAEAAWRDEAAEKTMALLQAVIVETRTIRAGNKIAPKDKLRLIVKRAGRRGDGRARGAGRVRQDAGRPGVSSSPRRSPRAKGCSRASPARSRSASCPPSRPTSGRSGTGCRRTSPRPPRRSRRSSASSRTPTSWPRPRPPWWPRTGPGSRSSRPAGRSSARTWPGWPIRPETEAGAMPVGTIVHRLESVPSTNDFAKDLALKGAAHGTAVVAGEQTRGRGTKGRVWHSPAGLGLYVSFILRGPGGGAVPFPHLIPLAAGLAASDAVRDAAAVETRLKWPNDILCARTGDTYPGDMSPDRKLGGILAEGVSGAAGGDFVVVGIGLNVGHDVCDFPEELRASATSVRLAAGRAVTVEAFWERALPGPRPLV